jgi:hypothetical protein
MKTLLLVILASVAVLISSCQKRGDSVSEVHFGGVIKSPDFDSTRGEEGSYWISYAGSPTRIVHAIFSDGRQIARGSTGGLVLMVDRDTNEEWTLKLLDEQQVVVREDRSTKDVPGFARYTSEGIAFADTEDQVLKRVVATYTRVISEQGGTGQSATRPESKSEGGDKPQPESEGHSR